MGGFAPWADAHSKTQISCGHFICTNARCGRSPVTLICASVPLPILAAQTAPKPAPKSVDDIQN
jgi:hypothetical protein